MDVIEQEQVTEMYQELMINVTKMRKRNAEKMKARWDTENTQKVVAGDFVLVDPRIKKKWRKKDKLGERIYSMPGIVLEVNSNGNIIVQYKDGSTTPASSPVSNNKFKVVDESLYNSVEMPIHAELESSEDSEVSVSFFFSFFFSIYFFSFFIFCFFLTFRKSLRPPKLCLCL